MMAFPFQYDVVFQLVEATPVGKEQSKTLPTCKFLLHKFPLIFVSCLVKGSTFRWNIRLRDSQASVSPDSICSSNKTEFQLWSGKCDDGSNIPIYKVLAVVGSLPAQTKRMMTYTLMESLRD